MVKQWFMCRKVGEVHIIRETVLRVYIQVDEPYGVVKVVKQWFTSLTAGKLYIIRETRGFYTSRRFVRVV